MNEGLFTAYYDLPQWKKLLDRLGDGQCTLKFKKHCTSRYQKKSDQGFLGGSVVKNALVNADEKGSTCIRHELKHPR